MAPTQSSTFSHLSPLGSLTSARAQLFFFFEGTQTPEPCPEGVIKEESWGPLMDTAFAPHLQQNLLPFDRTRKPLRHSTQNLSVTLILNPCSTSEGGTRPSTHAPTVTTQWHGRVWPGPGLHEPSLHWLSGRGARQHWSPQTGRARQSDLFHDQGSVTS